MLQESLSKSHIKFLIRPRSPRLQISLSHFHLPEHNYSSIVSFPDNKLLLDSTACPWNSHKSYKTTKSTAVAQPSPCGTVQHTLQNILFFLQSWYKFCVCIDTFLFMYSQKSNHFDCLYMTTYSKRRQQPQNCHNVNVLVKTNQYLNQLRIFFFKYNTDWSITVLTVQNSFHIPVNFLLMCKEIYNAKCQTHSQFIWFFFLLQSYFVFLRLKNFSYSLLSTNLAPRRASHVHSCVSTVGFCAQKANKYLESWNYYHIFYLFFFLHSPHITLVHSHLSFFF